MLSSNFRFSLIILAFLLLPLLPFFVHAFDERVFLKANSFGKLFEGVFEQVHSSDKCFP
jgi:hypothetical protein